MADSYGVYISGLVGDVEAFVAGLVAQGMSEATARKVAASIPAFVKRQVSLEVAQKYKRVFEQAGAFVMIEDWDKTNNPAAFTPYARPADGPALELAEPALGTPLPPAIGYHPGAHHDLDLGGAGEVGAGALEVGAPGAPSADPATMAAGVELDPGDGALPELALPAPVSARSAGAPTARDERGLGLPGVLASPGAGKPPPSAPAAASEGAPAGSGRPAPPRPEFARFAAHADTDGTLRLFGRELPAWAEPIVATVLALKWKLIGGGLLLMCTLYGYGCVKVTGGINHLRNNLGDLGVALENANARGRAVGKELVVREVQALAEQGGIAIPASAIAIFPERIRFERLEGGVCRLIHLPDTVQRLPPWERDRILMGARTCDLPNWIVRIGIKTTVRRLLYSREVDLTRYAAVLNYEGGYE
jgi:hypothetical protein